ncbi:hypothetical protein SNE40_003039 [Patella caerulea]|uniref:DDE Tnp4 domain-containing protein n=1 Tax=Patella caerulea TaxID=87958 RepID=A0AAN8K789_PATCE
MTAPIDRCAIYAFLEEILNENDDYEDSDIAPIIPALISKRPSVPKVEGFTELVINLNEEDFRYHCRLNKETFMLLLGEVEAYLVPDVNYVGGGYDSVPPKKQLLVFVWYLSNQCSMRNIAFNFKLSKSTVHSIVHHVAGVISALSYKFIQWPNNQRRREIKGKFTKIPGVIGVIDGTHIRITNPVGNDRSYLNRKKFCSVVLQVVVDDMLMINDVFVGYPGSAHDARVLRNSPIYEKAEDHRIFEDDDHLLGDSAYPVKNWLIPPFKDNGQLTPHQRNFNYNLSSDRQVVERAIGHLKGRFRKLRDIPFTDQCGDRSRLMQHICEFIISI